mgnify:CR=1 FL=1
MLTLRVLIFLVVYATVLSVHGQEYAVLTVDKGFLEDAPAIVRNNIDEVLVEAGGKITYRKKTVFTIFNKSASELAILQVPYSNQIKVRSISGAVYDPLGKLLFKNKKSDIADFSNFSSFSIYEDNRVKVLNLQQVSYPYTVEFEYELELPNLYYLPDWVPQTWSIVPVEAASITYEYPANLNLRFFSKNILLEDVVTGQSGLGMISKTWKLDNISAFSVEPLMPADEQLFKRLYAAPSDFVYDGYTGNLSSWESMGAWIYSLNKGKNQISDQTKRDVMELISDKENDLEKIKAIYQYMQNRTRYVSIQVGIGGLMPFDAMTVDKSGYGDCKALSNYMAALLETAGISSQYALIFGGDKKRPVFEEFPNDYFNHAILAVPLAQDTIWLECTSQTNPFGFLGSFTSDRHALLVSEKGGKLVKTPSYQLGHNTQKSRAVFELEDSGNAKGKLNIEARGLQVENNNLLRVAVQSNEDKKKWLLNHLPLKSFDVLGAQFEIDNMPIPEVLVHTDVQVRSLANKSGSRLFLQPNQLNVYSANLGAPGKSRKNSFERQMAFDDDDEITYLLPPGFQIESMPSAVELESEFGIYQAGVEFLDGNIIYRRKLKMFKGTYPPDKFEGYREFVNQIEKADKIKLVLKQTTTAAY